MEAQTIDSGLFSRYAATHLDRWRELIGQDALHADARWGVGRVEDVRWGSCCDHVAPYVQVRVRYPGHGLVVFRATSFGARHRSVTVPPDLRRILEICFEEPCDEATRSRILARRDRTLREARDRDRLERAAQLRRGAARRTGSTA